MFVCVHLSVPGVRVAFWLTSRLALYIVSHRPLKSCQRQRTCGASTYRYITLLVFVEPTRCLLEHCACSMWPMMFSGLENLVADLEDHNPATLLSISAIACIILSYAIRWLIATHRDQAFAAKHGCKPAKSVMPKATDFWLSIKDIANKTYLETAVKRYAEWSTTYEATAPFFAKEVFTIDPENMKTILATNFEQWELGSRRRLMLRDLIQNSIFVVDGKAWEHSRVSKQSIGLLLFEQDNLT